AVPVYLRRPVMVSGSAAEAVGVQGLNLGAGEVAAPLIVDHPGHGTHRLDQVTSDYPASHPVTDHPVRHASPGPEVPVARPTSTRQGRPFPGKAFSGLPAGVQCSEELK